MIDKNKFKYIFGPVPSRRLGFSLGIDLVPYKTCSYDCIYCQLGKTTLKTVSRGEYVPLDEVMEETSEKLKQDSVIDYITLSGSGEPTLYSKIKELIGRLKEKTNKPVAVLTNGSFLWDKNIQNDLMEADLIIPSLDAGDENIYRYVNRPHSSLSYKQVTEGIADFCKKFKGKIWIEVFLLHGVTSISSEVKKIKAQIKKINHHKIHLNTVVRPPAEFFAYPVPKDQLYDCAKLLGTNVEIISDFNKIYDQAGFKTSQDEILNLIKRRPCSLDDISKGLFIHPNEALKYLERLISGNQITTIVNNKELFYITKKA